MYATTYGFEMLNHIYMQLLMMLVGLYFDVQETLNGYYNISSQILKKYGVPAKFKTDRRTVLEYKKKVATSVEEDTFTQFSYACSQLGIENGTKCIVIKSFDNILFDTINDSIFALDEIPAVQQNSPDFNELIKEPKKKYISQK